MDLTFAQFRAGLQRAAQRRRLDEARAFGSPRHALKVPQSALPPDLVAELDAIARADHADHAASSVARCEPSPQAKAALSALARA